MQKWLKPTVKIIYLLDRSFSCKVWEVSGHSSGKIKGRHPSLAGEGHPDLWFSIFPEPSSMQTSRAKTERKVNMKQSFANECVGWPSRVILVECESWAGNQTVWCDIETLLLSDRDLTVVSTTNEEVSAHLPQGMIVQIYSSWKNTWDVGFNKCYLLLLLCNVIQAGLK